MSDSRNSRKTGSTPPVRDAGHVRSREISAARSAAKGRGGSGQDEGRSRPADTERLRRRARFLRERNEAQELRDRVQPRRARSARRRQAMRMRTFRW